ncbi:hypothetical protein CA11_05570 [Gimesia maris]|nr:hypothetical protein CA11_05570 [Gimesia maris]
MRNGCQLKAGRVKESPSCFFIRQPRVGLDVIRAERSEQETDSVTFLKANHRFAHWAVMV